MVRALVLLLLCTRAVLSETPSAEFRIDWDTNRSLVTVTGPISEVLRTASAEQLARVFPVTVEPKNVLKAIGLPAIVGTYSARSDVLQFQPQYPFEPGVVYRATFAPASVSSVLRMPRRSSEPTTLVAGVYPSSEVLPQNLLKFYLHFSAPMSRGHIYDHIHLLDEKGRSVELPFLEIDEELWNADMTRLTLFLDPGRIKRGVRPLEEVGPALLPNHAYTLRIDPGWLDGQGAPLKQPFEKLFRVTDPDRQPPDPALWRVTPPRRGTTDAVVIDFGEPMDEALALRMLSIRAVTGHATLEEHETRWRFTPAQSWKAGRYELLIQSTIEDLAGNNIGKPFEVDLQESGRPQSPAQTVSLFFAVP